jgi:plasmid stability protein
MSKMIQLRKVPDELHRKLKARAATEGMSMSDFITREARRAVERLSDDEILARLAAQPVAKLKISPARIIREERDRR